MVLFIPIDANPTLNKKTQLRQYISNLKPAPKSALVSQNQKLPEQIKYESEVNLDGENTLVKALSYLKSGNGMYIAEGCSYHGTQNGIGRLFYIEK